MKALALLALLFVPPQADPLLWHWDTEDPTRSELGGRLIPSEGFEPVALELELAFESTTQYDATATSAMTMGVFGFADGYDNQWTRLYWLPSGGGSWVLLGEMRHEAAYHHATALLPGLRLLSPKYHQATALSVTVTDPQVLGALGETAGLHVRALSGGSYSATGAGFSTVDWGVNAHRTLRVNWELVR